MDSLKAPEPDGFPVLFFLKFWDVVGESVTKAVLDVLNNNASMDKLGEAVVVLIPKVKLPVRVTEFRPISLCNVVYKVVAKMVANRLKVVLEGIISQHQSALVPGRLITDNVAEASGNVHGIKVARGAHAISHLLFADDSLIFARATVEECKWLVDILKCYEAASGQSINFEKSALSFSPNVSIRCVNEIKSLFNIGVVSCHDKYLGLPSSITRNKRQVFEDIKDRVWQKLQGWKNKLFSVGGREVLIKAIAQAIPTYAMGCFRLPASLMCELNKLFANFWWGWQIKTRKLIGFRGGRCVTRRIMGNGI
ncbi:hypothetical protein Ddye_003650 [Dipteronia dyeriana]|uniref:Reverse transcriptase domain-containing protein n=1 Tax=Dipteronia dyeriana TaxID=168575 RepID=A0AAD9XTA0_9ROSI|nr:hypothetical protein Ddye_003650 [Dipteronia dyeriana]